MDGPGRRSVRRSGSYRFRLQRPHRYPITSPDPGLPQAVTGIVVSAQRRHRVAGFGQSSGHGKSHPPGADDADRAHYCSPIIRRVVRAVDSTLARRARLGSYTVDERTSLAGRCPACPAMRSSAARRGRRVRGEAVGCAVGDHLRQPGGVDAEDLPKAGVSAAVARLAVNSTLLSSLVTCPGRADRDAPPDRRKV